MSKESLDMNERNNLIAKLQYLENQRYPSDRSQELPVKESALLREQYYQVLGEYSDRLPRVILSKCPHCREPLKRTFDLYGLDGPWWWLVPECKFEEPQHCEHFQVLLGAVSFHGREPREVITEVRPGTGVPFVVPILLDLPEMAAVIGEIKLATGDTAYPIAYFSTTKIQPNQLHQPWCRNELWFKDEDGNSCWTAANNKFDFDLLPYVRDGRLRWVDLSDPELTLHPVNDEPCPFIDLPGDRECQQIVGRERGLIGLPTGEPLNPFE